MATRSRGKDLSATGDTHPPKRRRVPALAPAAAAVPAATIDNTNNNNHTSGVDDIPELALRGSRSARIQQAREFIDRYQQLENWDEILNTKTHNAKFGGVFIGKFKLSDGFIESLNCVRFVIERVGHSNRKERNFYIITFTDLARSVVRDKMFAMCCRQEANYPRSEACSRYEFEFVAGVTRVSDFSIICRDSPLGRDLQRCPMLVFETEWKRHSPRQMAALTQEYIHGGVRCVIGMKFWPRRQDDRFACLVFVVVNRELYALLDCGTIAADDQSIQTLLECLAGPTAADLGGPFDGSQVVNFSADAVAAGRIGGGVDVASAVPVRLTTVETHPAWWTALGGEKTVEQRVRAADDSTVAWAAVPPPAATTLTIPADCFVLHPTPTTPPLQIDLLQLIQRFICHCLPNV